MPHDIIDNSKIKLSTVLKEKLSVSKRARFAVGWFFLTGLKEIKDEIEHLEKIELLVGSKTNRQTAETMLLERKYEEAVEDAIENRKYLPQQEIDKLLAHELDTLVNDISFIKPTQENIEFIKWFFQKLQQGKIEVRIYPKEALHAKLYLLDYKDTRHGRGIAFVGSSNLSMSGFNLNTELNVVVHGDDNHKNLTDWFEKRWNESDRADFTALAQKALKKSWVLTDEVTPFRIYLRVLHEIFTYEEKREFPEAKYGEVELWDFQKDAVIDAYHRLNEFNGVFLADVPGLGKTYMGAALLAHLQEDGKKTIVICPPKLIEHWQEVLADFGVGTARVLSYGKLDDIINDERLMEREVILLDESHHFRNPNTDRYKDMEMICEGKKVIMVGATPQNLSIWDLYHQVKLFSQSEINHKFRIDPPSLKEYFKACEESKTADIEDLINQIVIRRTRKDITEFYGEDKVPSFPKREGPKRKDYSIDEVYPGGIYKKLNELIDKLTFARYDIGSYIKEEEFTPDERQRIKIAGRNLRKIMRIIIFRRLESSLAAFRDSIDIMLKSQKIFEKALDARKILVGEAAETVIDQLRAEVDLEDVEIPEYAYDAKRFHVKDLKNGISKDKEIFGNMYKMVEDLKPEEDNKLKSLIELLDSKDIKGKKALIFTAFTSTAKYIGAELNNKFNKVDFVSLDIGKVLTKAKRFSPKSNRYKVKPSEEIDILVSTEILSEGLNLQDGQVIINYELHWNPVRIVQRIGRIDRIGSKHDKIWVYNFFPQEEAEKEINVEKKVKKRIDEIIQRFGADEKTITLDEKEVRKKLFQIYTEDKRSLEEEERESKSSYFRHQWMKLQRENSDEYRRALELPAMVISGLKSKEKGITVFCRADDYFRLILSNKDGEVINRNDWEILPLLQCSSEEPLEKILPNHLKVIEKVRDQFEKEVNDREFKKFSYLDKVKAQIIKKLEWAKRGKSEKVKKETDQIIDLVRNAKLGPEEKRELRKVRRMHGLSPTELLNKVKSVLENTVKEKRPTLMKKYAQIIISESLI